MRPEKLKPAGFDYSTEARGYWAKLRDGAGREVTLCEHPGSLLSMFRAGVLVGLAKEDAEKFAQDDPKSAIRPARTNWQRGQDAIHL